MNINSLTENSQIFIGDQPIERYIEPTVTAKKTSGKKYKHCSGGTYKLYCYNKPVIGKVQGCLGLKQDGYFGPKTQSALKSVGFGNGFTDQDVDKICKSSQKPNTQVRPKVKPVSTIKPRGIQGQSQTNTSQPTKPQSQPEKIIPNDTSSDWEKN